ncbi:MAG: hypothetical protein QOJ70_761 [Acidobacteriota bacterium]|jgi:hypothetical protein|nr:hypothetical protein [Acidobacteriota bacterium]
MSDEKRQTRLLPFRLRRTTNTPGGAARATDDGAEDFAADAELTTLLRAWDAPPPDARAHARLLADFRASVERVPLWRRAFAAELRVPLPLAACAALALLVSFFALGTRAWTRTAAAPPESSKTEAAQPVVKVVEVPVVEERVVTRTVYVEKKERTGGRSVLSKPDAAVLSTASDTSAQTEAEQPRQAKQGTQAGYFTGVNMEDFQPADEVKIRIVKRGSTDEK